MGKGEGLRVGKRGGGSVKGGKRGRVVCWKRGGGSVKGGKRGMGRVKGVERLRVGKRG